MNYHRILTSLFFISSSLTAVFSVDVNPDPCYLVAYRAPFSYEKVNTSKFYYEMSEWEESGSYPRSARYVLGKDEPINIEIYFKESKGEASYVTALNTTTMESVKMKCDLIKKINEYCYLYRTNEKTDCLYLSNSDTFKHSEAKNLKIKNGEVVEFSSDEYGSSKNGPSPENVVKRSFMIEAGKFAGSGTGLFSVYDQDTCENSDVFKHWTSVGCKGFGNALDRPSAVLFTSFINSSGDINDGGAQVLHLMAHGSPSGSLYDDHGPIFSPLPSSPYNSDLGGIPWDKSVKWLILHSCSAISPDSSGLGKWASMMIGKHSAHGILGATKDVWTYVTEYENFYSLLGNGRPFKEAYMVAMANVSGDSGNPMAVLTSEAFSGDKYNDYNQDHDDPNVTLINVGN
jgi:hypothetical protein